MSATIKFTEAQFKKMIKLAKAAIKENKADKDAYIEYEALEEFVDGIAGKQKEKQFALITALTNYFDSPRRPSAIANKLKKKGVWSDQWEEGSHAFATTEKKAVKAVKAIEAEHCMDDW